jgi:hypothetical protein
MACFCPVAAPPKMKLNKRLLLLTGWLLLAWMGAAWSKAPACPAYEQLRPLLNSERIQACFGSYGVEVLQQQDNLRISSLYSLDSVGGSLAADVPATNREQGSHCAGMHRCREGQEPESGLLHVRGSEATDIPAHKRITRTLAISEFASDLPESLQAPYQAIHDGASMGATLEAAGWQVDKRLRYLGEVPASTTFRCMSGLPADSPQVMAVQVYDLWVLRDGQKVRFSLLAELHDPRYLTLQDLQRIYPDMTDQLQPLDPSATRLLQKAGQLCKANETP